MYELLLRQKYSPAPLAPDLFGSPVGKEEGQHPPPLPLPRMVAHVYHTCDHAELPDIAAYAYQDVHV